MNQECAKTAIASEEIRSLLLDTQAMAEDIAKRVSTKLAPIKLDIPAAEVLNKKEPNQMPPLFHDYRAAISGIKESLNRIMSEVDRAEI